MNRFARGYVCVKQCQTMPQPCPGWALSFFEAEVIAAGAVDFAFAPFQFLDGSAEHGEVGDIFGLQVIAKFVLDGCSGP